MMLVVFTNTPYEDYFRLIQFYRVFRLYNVGMLVPSGFIIHLRGNGKKGRWILDNGGVYQAVAEHIHTVHRYAINVRPV